MKAAMIFDMDGTIFQTNRILENALQDAFQYLRDQGMWKGAAPLDEYKEIMGVPLPVVWGTLLPHHPVDVRKTMNEIFHERLIENIYRGNGSLYPHAADLFEYLSQRGYPIYIASNGQPKYLKAIVEHYRLGRWISDYYSIQSIQSGDKGELIRSIKEEHQLSYGMVIGDRLSDFMAAHANQFLSVGCAFDFSQAHELAEADIVVDDLIEVKKFLEKVKE
ncbi:HAD hydrolase-like protein [Bacillus sp. KH172YL63]|uniref:HAD hydrolase-like protein n=1 Tax=Bacillus sp. KH172YL63 TaxID=2709784 RepID=UPI0013E4811A|nr:HAD hydrolase-like protein [Bacillus sp. KH172YL63]BCB03553.1 MTA/SAH nucleosidase [Bacillus sp. KH172YL63]